MTKRYLSIVTFCLLAVMPVRALLAGDGLYPEVPKAKARFSDTQECVEPVEDMRKNHMEYILHQRDATVHEGIRTRQHSLVECINCHVSDAPDTPRVNSEKHFCNSCHSYASVSIDCFRCHADRPVKGSDNHLLTPSTASHHIKHDNSTEALANGDANDE